MSTTALLSFYAKPEPEMQGFQDPSPVLKYVGGSIMFFFTSQTKWHHDKR